MHLRQYVRELIVCDRIGLFVPNGGRTRFVTINYYWVSFVDDRASFLFCLHVVLATPCRTEFFR